MLTMALPPKLKVCKLTADSRPVSSTIPLSLTASALSDAISPRVILSSPLLPRRFATASRSAEDGIATSPEGFSTSVVAVEAASPPPSAFTERSSNEYRVPLARPVTVCSFVFLLLPATVRQSPQATGSPVPTRVSYRMIKREMAARQRKVTFRSPGVASSQRGAAGTSVGSASAEKRTLTPRACSVGMCVSTESTLSGLLHKSTRSPSPMPWLDTSG